MVYFEYGAREARATSEGVEVESQGKDYGDQIMMVRDEGTNEWRISAVLANSSIDGHMAANFTVNDGTGVVVIDPDKIEGGNGTGEDTVGRALRTMELIIQAYNSNVVPR